MRALRRTATLLAGALVLPVLAAPALAVNDPVTGYWTRTRVGPPLPVQPPDRVPEGGSWVAGDPAGPVAVTAVRAGSDDGNVVAGIRLTVADALGSVEVLVCPTTERWAPEQGGRLEAAPEADCTTPIETVVEEDVLVVALPPELQTDVVDLLLTPAPGSAFSVTFEKATAEAIVQAPGDGGMGGSTPLPTRTQPEEDVGPPSGSSGGFSGGFSGGTDFGVPEVGPPALASEPLLPAPELPPPAQVQGPQPQAAPPPPVVLTRPAAVVPVDRTASLMAVALLVGLVALALRLAVQPAAAPRHLGGGARLSRATAAPAAATPAPAAPVATARRGVGRFRSERLRPPVRI